MKKQTLSRASKTKPRKTNRNVSPNSGLGEHHCRVKIKPKRKRKDLCPSGITPPTRETPTVEKRWQTPEKKRDRGLIHKGVRSHR